MARSLRDLVEFLLEEISLCGAQGASPAAIVELIDAYYSSPVRVKSQYVNKRTAQRESSRTPKLDRPFKEKVWTWLTRNPEVSVGKNRQGNGLSLSEVLGPNYEWQEKNEQPQRGAFLGGNGKSVTESVAYPAGIVFPESDSATELQKSAESNSVYHVFVTEERMWLAITGHGPDKSKVLPMEFALLSIIASQKGNGIIQTELVRVSGQDKRSVPKRTDALAAKGYIEKKPIQARSARTSLCTLRKFVGTPSYLDGSFKTPAERGKAFTPGPGDVIDFKVFLDNLFKCLKEYNVITRSDLKDQLGMADSWRWKILSRALRKLEKMGFVKRLRAASEYSKTTYHPSVMLIKEPTEQDLRLFYENSKNLLTFTENEESAGQDLEDGDESAPTARSNTQSPSKAMSRIPKKEGIEDSGRIIPRWTPERTLPNLIFDAIEEAGLRGMTNNDIRAVCFGSFFRRSLEVLLNRMVVCWQYSQPPHIRHFAIIRDTALRGTITHYVHHSYRHFKHLVESGQASWEAVEYVPKGSEEDKQVSAVDAVAKFDDNGFPIRNKPYNLVNGGDATLRECQEAAKPRAYHLSSSDPTVVRLKDGSYGVRKGRKKLPAGALQRSKNQWKPSAKRIRTDTGMHVISDVDPGQGMAEFGPEYKTGRKESKVQRGSVDPFEGMSRKEILIAQGYDESWTEFCALVQERTEPGVYITPRGKRRATGKQGRPRISRIAVFKSEKLKEFSWFTKPEEPVDSGERSAKRKGAIGDNDYGLPARKYVAKRRKVAHNIADDTVMEPSSGDVHKRKLAEGDSGLANSIEIDDEPQRKRKRVTPQKDKVRPRKPIQKRGRPSKGTAKSASKQAGQSDKATSANDNGFEGPTPAAPERHPTSMDRTISPLPYPGQVPGPEERSTIAQVVSCNTANAAAFSSEIQASKPSDIPDVPAPPSSSKGEPSSTTNSPFEEAYETVGGAGSRSEVSDQATRIIDTPSQTPDPKSKGAVPRENGKLRMPNTRGGFVAFLRKKIVMEIMEKCGGIFPLGFELWYPFTTAWMKSNQTGKPDLRTIKSTVKTLADSGKLRQLTFSGKDNRGVMTTRTLITLPEIEPTDPRIQKVQKAVLLGDNSIYEGVEVDPTLRKSRSLLPPGGKGTWPEVDLTVTVIPHQKPASIRNQETRKDLAVQRRLLRNSGATPEALQRIRLGRVGKRPSRRPRRFLKSSALEMVSGSRHRTVNAFQDVLDYGSQKSLGSGKARRPISALYPYSMLMCPKQSFHTVTGAFLTEGYPPQEYVEFLPSSLGEAIENISQFGSYKYKELDGRSRVFFSKIDSISAWETTIDAINLQTSDWNFINHTIEEEFECVPLESPIRYDRDMPPIFRPHVEPKVLRPFISRPILQAPQQYQYNYQTQPQMQPQPYPQRQYEPQVQLQLPLQHQAQTQPQYQLQPQFQRYPEPEHRLQQRPAPARVIRRRNQAPTIPSKSRRLSKLTEEQEATKTGSKPIVARDRPVVPRRHRFAKNLPKDVIQKLMVAIAVVRALAGAKEGKMIDWSIMTKIFPDYDTKFLQERTRTLLGSNRLQVSKMQSDFQDRYAEAYEKGKVPPIDYRDLTAYDWEWVVNWAQTQLETPTVRKLPSLPATRKQFNSLFEIRKDPPLSLNDMYQYNSSVTLPRKRALLAGVPFALPLQESEEPPRKRQRSDRLDTAKTWVRANVMAPEETYDPVVARRSLEHLFGENLVDSALRSLVTERVISTVNRGRPTPGRNYDVTDVFLNTLGRKRALESKQLKRAAYFKINILDEDIRKEGKHDLKYGAEDGDILVIDNLVAEGKVVLRPRDPPKRKYGLTDGGYLTRLMDKNRLRFGIDVFPVPDKYVYGNPTQEAVASVSAPRGDIERSVAALSTPAPLLGAMAAPPPPSQSPGKIPIWFDIHYRFIRVIWDLAIAAVIGTVAARPGISTKDITTVVKPSMEEWEIELALQWISKAELVERTRESSETTEGRGPGWAVKEWWWFAIGEREGVKT